MSSEGGHYFTSEPTSRSAPIDIDLTLPDFTVRLRSDSGVFAARSIDAGTSYLLLEGPPIRPSTATLLDLGCGYGPIAVTLAHRAPTTSVWAVDVNRRALELTAINAAGLEGVQVAHPEEVPPDIMFDEIWSNPPIRIGKGPLRGMLATWLDRLTPDGRAVFVVQRNLGADSLARWMTERGHSVERLGSRMGYRLLEIGARCAT